MTQRTIVRLSIALFAVTSLWGVYTTLVYFGIPAHQFVYMQSDQVQQIDIACGQDAMITTYLCRGSLAVVPFIQSFFLMMSPFFGYIVTSFLLLLVAVMYGAFAHGYFFLNVRVNSAMVIAAFAASVWLLGTTFSLGTLNNLNTSTPDPTPFSRLYEPTPDVYKNVDPQTLAALQANYQSLLDRGCLQQVLGMESSVKIYDLSPLCVQQSLLTRVGGQLILVLILLFNFLIAGLAFLRGLSLLFGNRRSFHPLLELCFSLGLGAFVWTIFLWFLAVFGVLNGSVVLPVFFGVPFLAYPFNWYWLRSAIVRRFDVHFSFSNVLVLLGWLLLSYLALNFLNVVRPFPIGWDDLGSYLNRPRLLASYGSFIPSMSQFQWEYLSSLGFLLFGIDPHSAWTSVGSTFAMQINWVAGLLAALTVYVFGRSFFGRRAGLLSAISYYFLPMVGHFSFADMKIDNAIFATSVLALLAAFVYFFGARGLSDDDADDTRHIEQSDVCFCRDTRLLIIAGLLVGFSFAIKPTAILTVLFLALLFFTAIAGSLGFFSGVLWSFLCLNLFGPLSFVTIAQKIGMDAVVPTVALRFFLLCIAIILFVIGLLRTKHWRRHLVMYGLAFLLFSGSFAMALFPWAAHNAYTNRSGGFSIAGLLSAADPSAPQIFYLQRQELPPPSSVVTPVRFLPPALKLDPNHPACKTSARTEELDRYWGYSSGIQHYATLVWREVMNLDSVGYYVTLMPSLLLFPLLLLLPFFWSKHARWLRYLFFGTLVFLLQWIFVGNGIAWYGVTMFFGFAVGLEALFFYAPDVFNRTIVVLLLVVSIMVCLLNRLWQFDTQRNLFEYPLGKITAFALQEMTVPDYDRIRDSVVQRHASIPDRPYTYRIGTFISYFIPRNREILPMADNQLGFFNCLYQERNYSLTEKRLKALGFNSIIFDTNTATIEKDPQGSLHQKVDAFIDFVNTASGSIKMVVNNPGNGIAYMLIE